MPAAGVRRVVRERPASENLHNTGHDALFGASGAVAIPLQGQFGAQIDGSAGGLDGRAFTPNRDRRADILDRQLP
jgi:hypothetical protein